MEPSSISELLNNPQHHVSAHPDADTMLITDLDRPMLVPNQPSSGTTLRSELSTFSYVQSNSVDEQPSTPSVQNLSSRLLSKNVNSGIYKIIILPAILYGCETWSLTLREELRLRVFENRVLKRIFGPKKNEVTGEWRKLRNEELRDLYSSPSYN
jgi:hypothetical protein